MRNILRKLLMAAFLAVMFAAQGWSQETLDSTTLGAAVDATTNTITLAADTTEGVKVGDMAFVDREAMRVTAVSTLTLTVTRGSGPTVATSHTSGETIYIDDPEIFGLTWDGKLPWGSCTSATMGATPRIDLYTGDIYRCTNSEWDREVYAGRVKAKLDLDLNLQTTSDARIVKLNSRDYTQTGGGSSIGFQVRPQQTVTFTGTVTGGEISPRVADDIDVANVKGLHVDAYLKGTTANTISGDVRALELELITDDAGTHTISGDVSAIRIRAAFSATTLTGDMVPFRVEKAEAQTNSQAWDALFKLTGSGTGTEAWGSDTGSGDTEGGYIKVLTDFDGNGTYTAMYIVLYSDAP